MNELLINSIGGCGSKYLTRQISLILENRSVINSHAHIASPLDVHSDVEKVVFVFGDLYLSLLSFFNRRKSITRLHGFFEEEPKHSFNEGWAKLHCRNLGGSYEKFQSSWGLRQYLKNQEDLFGVKEFFCNWFSRENLRKSNFEVIFLRYETLGEHFQDVLDFLDTKVDERRIEPFKSRGSSVEQLSDEEMNLLTSLYGDTYTMRSSLPDSFRKEDVIKGFSVDKLNQVDRNVNS